MQDGRLYLGDGLVKAVGYLVILDGSLDRVGRHKVRSPDDERLRCLVEVRDDCTDGNLNLLRRDFSDPDIMLLTQVILYV